MESYFANGLDQKYGGTPSLYTAKAGSQVSENNMKALFQRYASSNGVIDGEGIEKKQEDFAAEVAAQIAAAKK